MENESTRKVPVTLIRERGDELQWSISILKFQVLGPFRYQICEVGVMSEMHLYLYQVRTRDTCWEDGV